MQYDVVVLGAGAAGLFCAAEAGRRGRRVLVLEHNQQPGRKILISGGGRCNFTNRDVRPECFLSANPHFPKSALARYRPADFIALVNRYGIAWHEKHLGQLFCDGPAKQIVDMLLQECRDAGVTLRCGELVDGVQRQTGFAVSTRKGEVTAESLVVATGGPSIPKMGATGFAYELARQFGLKVQPPRPALVPLVFGPDDARAFGDLAGLALDVRATCGGQAFEERMLFTHRGLSGPAILQVSSYWAPGRPVRLDLALGRNLWERLLEEKSGRKKSSAKAVLGEWLPDRLAARWVELYGPERPLLQTSDAELRKFAESLAGWDVVPVGTEGFEKAEVTAGGVDTGELSSQTMEARAVAGLYFIGECVDVTGWLGGYNFQWAWASGYAAGQVV